MAVKIRPSKPIRRHAHAHSLGVAYIAQNVVVATLTLGRWSHSGAAVSNRNVFSAVCTVLWLSAERTGGCSRFWLQRQRNSDHRMYCWCVEQRTSQYPTIEACVDRSPRWADSRQQGTVAADRAATYGSAAPAWTLRVAGPAADGADELLA